MMHAPSPFWGTILFTSASLHDVTLTGVVGP